MAIFALRWGALKLPPHVTASASRRQMGSLEGKSGLEVIEGRPRRLRVNRSGQHADQRQNQCAPLCRLRDEPGASPDMGDG